MNKTIIVEWVPEDSFYRDAMRIIYSTHPVYRLGDRFDFGFYSIATEQGYTVISVPSKENL